MSRILSVLAPINSNKLSDSYNKHHSDFRINFAALFNPSLSSIKFSRNPFNLLMLCYYFLPHEIKSQSSSQLGIPVFCLLLFFPFQIISFVLILCRFHTSLRCYTRLIRADYCILSFHPWETCDYFMPFQKEWSPRTETLELEESRVQDCIPPIPFRIDFFQFKFSIKFLGWFISLFTKSYAFWF